MKRWLAVGIAICGVTATIAVPLLTGGSGLTSQACPSSTYVGSGINAPNPVAYNRLVKKAGGPMLRTPNGAIRICTPPLSVSSKSPRGL